MKRTSLDMSVPDLVSRAGTIPDHLQSPCTEKGIPKACDGIIASLVDKGLLPLKDLKLSIQNEVIQTLIDILGLIWE